MTKRMQLQKKSKKISAIAQNKNLSIQFSLDGFSFCITDLTTTNINLFSEYIFEKTIASPELLLEKIMYIFANDKDLQQDFKSVSAIHQNNLATIVPNDFFDRNNLVPYLKYSVKTLATDFITYDNLSSINANTVYIPYVNINNYLFQNFGEFEYKHHASVLIDKLIATIKNSSIKTSFFINVTSNFMDVIVIENEKLILYNSFSYSCKEDFIYYILFTAEQLQMNPEEFQLTFLGKIEVDSELYKITYNYIRNINFIESTTCFFNEDDDFSNHSNYILLS